MPPPSSPFGDDAVTDDQPYLSDEDVAVLHNIVAKAQGLPHAEQLPFRALFEAYDAVLAERGPDPDHDPIYFRFLLRLGALPGAGTLYEKFETLLASLGISIEFDGDDESRPQSPDSRRLDDQSRVSAAPPGSATRTARRASFSSFQDTIHDRTLRQLDHRPRRVSFTTVQDAGKDASRGFPRSPARRPSQAAQARVDRPLEGDIGAAPTHQTRKPTGSHGHPSRPGITSRQIENFPPSFHASDPSLVDHNREQRRLPLRPRTRTREGAPGGLPASDPASRNERDGGARNGLPGTESGDAPEARSSVPVSKLVSVAQRFDRQRLVQACFRKWHQATGSVEPLHRQMELRAIQFDQRILLRQALDAWRILLKHKRQMTETERFFAHLEQRAKKARDLYLLSKAFTHWAQLAHEGVQRTSVARRHLLRLKYFSAWQHLTTVNELKVRRFGLKQSFALWKHQVVELLARELQAVTTYRENLTRRMYWTWFWRFCERKAPEWYEGITKRKHLHHWIAVLQARRDRCRQIEGERNWDRLQLSWHLWREHRQLCAQQEEKALRWRRQKILQRAMASWRTQVRLAPVARTVSRHADFRLLQRTVHLWRARAEAEQYATRTNEFRLLKNAWTAWNDRLRCQSLAAQIDDRVVLQALYKWVLAERYVLCRRLFDCRLKRRILRSMLHKREGLTSKAQEGERRVERLEDRRIMKSVLGRWRARLQLHAQRIKLASDFAAPRATQEVLQHWVRRSKQVEQLDHDAESARYFFLATKTLRLWKSAVTRSRRQKRLAAYAYVRRKNKMALARGVIRAWRDRTHQAAECDRQATEFYQNHIQAVGIRCFDGWRARLWQVAELSEEASALQKSMALQGTLVPWRERTQRVQELDVKATYHAQLLTLKQASTLLRKLSLLAFQYRSHERNAEEFRQRNDRQHIRRMFRYWRDKAAQRFGVSPLDSLEHPSLSNMTTLAEASGPTTITAGDGTQAQHDPVRTNQLATSTRATPLPGYLATPSSRIARATALMRLSTATTTTTPGPRTPQATPFETRLRSQLFTDRRAPSRNVLRSSRFAPEEP